MKKNIIALAVVSAFAAPLAMADAPIIYGQINMALEQLDVKNAGVKDNSESGTQVNSRNSRIGIKGSEDLGDGLKAIYQLEYTAAIDAKKGDPTFTARNQFVGLAGGFGTVLMGRHDTPVKMIQGTDLFDDGALGDNGPMAGGLGLLNDGMETRLNNALAYISPEFAGIKLLAAGSASEQGNATTSKSEITDMYSLALTYGSKKKGLYLAVGGEQADAAFTAGGKAKHARAVVQYAAGGLIANVMYQKTGGSALTLAQKGQNVQANLGYKMGKLMPKVKVSSVDYKDSAIKDATNFGIGLDYALGKKTTTYIEYVEINNYEGARLSGAAKTDRSAVTVGMIHKF